MARTTGESIVELQTQMQDIDRRLTSLDTSIKSLHSKFDELKQNYVPQSTFNEYKISQKEKEKNRWLEIIITVLVTAVVSGLVAFFLRANGV